MVQSSVIILVHNDWDLVKKCIYSVISNTNNYEIIFVIDRDVTFKEELKKFGSIIEGCLSFNFAGRVNQGIKTAKGEYIVILNDDTEPRRFWLEQMIRANRQLGPGLVSARCQAGGCSNRDAWGEGDAQYSNYSLNMFATLIPRRLIDIIGFLDESFIYYGGEDDDYTLRARRHNIPTIISGGVVFHHVSKGFTPKRIRELLPRTKKLFRQKWGVNIPIPPDQNWRDIERRSYSRPLISVLMATHNHKEFIEEAIISTIRQSYDNFELLIGIDGGDQEGLPEIISSFKDNRIKIIISTERLGSCAMRNMLFNHSRGEFIAIMDSDDIMLPGRLETQLSYIGPEIDIVHSAYIIDKDSERSEVQNYPVNKNMLLSQQNYVAGGTFLMRRYVLTKASFDQSFNRASDFEFILRNFDKFSFYYTPEPAIIYRRHSGIHESGNADSCAQHAKVIEAYK